jgi:hypothetical protein
LERFGWFFRPWFFLPSSNLREVRTWYLPD